jgi:hypothetical protein
MNSQIDNNMIEIPNRQIQIDQKSETSDEVLNFKHPKMSVFSRPAQKSKLRTEIRF